MRYKLLGKSGLRVSGLCLGTMGYMDGLHWGTCREDSRRIYDAFLEAGGNFIDTANTYGEGDSERFLGEFMAADRDRVVLTTKYGGKYVSGEPNMDANCAGSHRKSLSRAVEASLGRLKTDYIDLLWVHSWDSMTPVEEVMRGLDDLIRQGKILYIGVSNAPAWNVAQANTLAELRGWTPFIAMQVEYSLIERDVERELLPMARALDIGIAAWTPLAGGLLSGKYNVDGEMPRNLGEAEPRRLDDPVMGRFAPRNERNMAIAAEVCKIASEIGCAPAHVALNWLRHRGAIPIFGARTVAQVKENLACFEYDLSEEQVQRLQDVSKIKLGFPHDFLASGIVKKFTYGGMFDLIENHRR
jgi:aryl-alcohol dehydrogenase-like predicted oxidoreductase